MGKKHVKVLKLAKKYIKSGKTNFVCIAVVQAGEKLSLSDQAEDITNRIRNSLKGYVTISSWLIWEEHINPVAVRDCIEKYRLKWIDWMIEGYKK